MELLGMKTTKSEMNNTVDRNNSSLNTVEESMSTLEYPAIEATQKEARRRTGSISELWHNCEKPYVCNWGSARKLKQYLKK